MHETGARKWIITVTVVLATLIELNNRFHFWLTLVLRGAPPGCQQSTTTLLGASP